MTVAIAVAAPELDLARLRPSRSLDGTWRFVADPERIHDPDALPEGEPIEVPGAWEAQVTRPYGIVTAWYHRELEVPEAWRGGRVVARFGAVMYRCTVFLNGVLVGGHEGGYTRFSIDLTPAIRWGEPNRLALQVVNPLNALESYPAFSVEQISIAEEFEPDTPLGEAPHGKQTWYSSHSGLWQPASLERTSSVGLAGPSVRCRLGASLLDPASVEIGWTLEGLLAADDVDRRVAVRILDPDGAEVASASVPLAAPGRGSVTLMVPEPRLWDIGQGVLYRAEVRLLEDGNATDGVGERFGIREIEATGGQVRLNRRPVYVVGALDQDVWPDTISTPPSREAVDEELARARELGLNLLRCHIKVPDPCYLEAADEAGMLLWCELPNWSRFTSAAAARGIDTLRQMVETLGNHPSIVAWTVINEDWGTQLRYEARDRRWLRQTVDWLKALDPTRLVVDNSACETNAAPNFHVRTDLLDFHLYHLVPDNAPRWRSAIEELARRPAWLWSPHGDAEPRGDEPIVLSEFGSWGLPRVDPLLAGRNREPWWFRTGLGYYRPTGVRRRFGTLGLDRIWGSLDELAVATQWHQFEAYQYEVGQVRRHGSIQGFVVTELTDAFWEANGLLDLHRRPKAYHRRLADLNGQDAVIADLERRDLWSDDRLAATISLTSFGRPSPTGRIRWALEVEGSIADEGAAAVDAWPRATTEEVVTVHAAVPDVDAATEGWLRVEAIDAVGRSRAHDRVRVVVYPRAAAVTTRPRRVHVVDPGGLWGVEAAVQRLGHRVVARADAELVVTTELTGELVRRIEDDGLRCLVLVRTRDALERAKDLSRRVTVVLRKLPVAGAPGQRNPWEGDWVTAFSWILPEAIPGLRPRNPLGFEFREVLPDHVLIGYDPVRHRDEVPAGMFVGWVHSPAALIWTFRQGGGQMTLTTFHLAPESGPVATHLLEQLMQQVAG